MITLDANVMIARVNHHDASHARAVAVLDHHEWEEYLTSAVTLAEALVHPVHAAIMTSDALVTFDARLAPAARAAGFPVIERAPDEPDWGPPIAS